jgi:hypothetical protein
MPMSRFLRASDTLSSSAADLREILVAARPNARIEVGRWEAPARIDAEHAIAIAGEVATAFGITSRAAPLVMSEADALLYARDALGFHDDDAGTAAMPYEDAEDAVALFADWFAGAVYAVARARTSVEWQTLVVAIDARSAGALAICIEALK